MKKKFVGSISSHKGTPTANCALWQELKAGDPKAFEKIYRTYIQLVYNYARKLSDDQELMEDCIQDLFADIWKSRQHLGEVVSIRYYLYASIKRKIIKERLKRVKYLEESLFFDILMQEDIPSYENDVISREEHKIQRKNLTTGLRSLNQVQRKAIILKFYRNLSYQEIAESMSLTVGNVYKIISRGLKILEQNVHRTTILMLFCLFF